MRKYFTLLSIAVFTVSIANAQHWRIKPTEDEIAYRMAHPQPSPISTKKTTSVWTMPADAVFPGEFEESQAVAIAWVYDYNAPYPVDVTSSYADVWGDMANAIQQECPVWIRIAGGNDSTTIKQFMANRGTPLTNYRFFVAVADDFWTRDYGPLGFYYGSNDDIGFLDMNYYDGRGNDDLFPELLANQIGYTNVRTNLYAEGGNYITDGFGKTFHSNVITGENNYNTTTHAAWSAQTIKDTMSYVWATNNIMETPALQCDGGTGHNDMFMKLADENTFAIMEYPPVVTAQDKNIILNTINTISQTNNIYGRPYRIFKLPMPTQDNGDTLKTCSAINNDARTYINGLTVNKTYLMPAFSDATTGNKTQDASAVKIFNRMMPGYKVVPLDARGLTILGGAIHCVTMQIPAENPVRFWHPPVIDLQPLQNSFHIVAKITNKSGIATSICNWRVKGTTSWNTVNLADSAGYKIGDINGTFSKTDQVEYYLSATSNNGKTMTKPIVAPTGGYYTFYFEIPASVNGLDADRNFVLNPLPNPTQGTFIIPVSFEASMYVQATVTDVFGKKVSSVDFGKIAGGMNKLSFDLGSLPAGMYFIQVSANDQLIGTKRIMKQ